METQEYWTYNSDAMAYSPRFNRLNYNSDTIVFKYDFNKPIEINGEYYNIISKYTKLIFSNYEKLYDCIKNKNYSIHHGSFAESKFNQPIDEIQYGLPKILTHVIFGHNFNYPVNLHEGLILLIFGSKFNQPIDNLPSSLMHLEFSCSFNQPINKLPTSLKFLRFIESFNQPINLPPGLTHLTFDCRFDRPVILPDGLEYLCISNDDNSDTLDNLPSSITELELGYYIKSELNNLPNGIKKIKFFESCQYDKELNCLPDSVEIIELDRHYSKPILNKPKNLIQLVCSKDYKYIGDFANFQVITY